MTTQATVLLVEDDRDLRDALRTTLDLAGFQTLEAGDGHEALIALERQNPDIVISDISMDRMDGQELLKAVRERDEHLPFVMMTAFASVQSAVKAFRHGATDYLQKPFEPKQLIDVVSRYIRTPLKDGRQPIIVDPRSEKLFALAKKVAVTDTTVLLTGQSGSGKEVLARYIHCHSLRADGPFVAINCAAIPENMLEATLFGYEKGAFTGAHQARPGKFELADKGSLLLDEVSEMGPPLQAKLLRVLQEREVERIGGRGPKPVDVRVIATSNRNLREEVAKGNFREDLFYRLNVFPIEALSLKDRPLDIVPIAEAFVETQCAKIKRPVPVLSNEAKRFLQRYSWPGNVRELENVMQRALIMSQGGFIEIQDIHLESESSEVTEASVAEGKSQAGGLLGQVRETEFQVILDALDKHEGCRASVARELGISPRTLRYKLAKMREAGIKIPKTRGKS